MSRVVRDTHLGLVGEHGETSIGILARGVLNPKRPVTPGVVEKVQKPLHYFLHRGR